VLDREDVRIRPERGAAYILETLADTCKTVIGRVRGRKQKLMAMVIAAPGRVDVRSGAVLEAGNLFHWRDVAVGEYLRRIFRVPVQVENDVNLAALGEMHYGLCRGVQNFVLIRLSTGVGAGLVLGGKLFQGNHWAAGEIGHMVFGREAAAGEVSERGYLESAIGSDRLRERVRLARANEAVQAALSGGGETNGEPSDSIGLDDPAAAGIVEDLASHLGLAAADLVSVVDPELIVLNGELFDLVTEQIRDVVKRVIPWPVRIERSALGDQGALLGAIGSARGLAHELICDTGNFESRVQE
jgi:glucokinase